MELLESQEAERPAGAKKRARGRPRKQVNLQAMFDIDAATTILLAIQNNVLRPTKAATTNVPWFERNTVV